MCMVTHKKNKRGKKRVLKTIGVIGFIWLLYKFRDKISDPDMWKAMWREIKK